MTKAEKIRKILDWSRAHTVQNNAYCFLPGAHDRRRTSGDGLLGKVQDMLKVNGRLYYTLLSLFGPVMLSSAYRETARACLEKYGENHVIINLGSGPAYFFGRKDIINIDVFALDEVDIVADAANLPLADGSVDFIISIAMLEHVVNPRQVVQEMHRILKKDGEVFAYVPFVQPYHAAPYDFSRWNHQGIKKLFSGFDVSRIFIGSGPTSGMLYVLEEWLAILLSFGSKFLHDMWFLLLMMLLFPVKFLDVILNRSGLAANAASGFGIVARKGG
ncbi:MAG: methyltransferase domain-containing protein [Thermodesulfobacteriota bacterium]